MTPEEQAMIPALRKLGDEFDDDMISCFHQYAGGHQTMLRYLLRRALMANARLYDLYAHLKEQAQSRLPDAETGIESAVRHSEATQAAGMARELASKLRELAELYT